DRDVLVDRRIGDHVLVALLPDRGGGDERGEIDLKARGRVEVPLPRDQRMDLAQPAAVLTADQHTRAASRMEERLPSRCDLNLHPELSGKRLEHALERVELCTDLIPSPVC